MRMAALGGTALCSVLAITMAVAGCATGSAAGGGASSNVLTAQQLEGQPMSDLYDAVRRLRPRSLVERGPSTLQATGNPVVVYVDNQRMGGVEELRSISIFAVAEVRYLDAGSATTRYGTGHTSGAIQVTTRR